MTLDCLAKLSTLYVLGAAVNQILIDTITSEACILLSIDKGKGNRKIYGIPAFYELISHFKLTFNLDKEINVQFEYVDQLPTLGQYLEKFGANQFQISAAQHIVNKLGGNL